MWMFSIKNCVILLASLLFHITIAEERCSVSVNNLRVSNWDLNFMTLQWHSEVSQTSCSGPIEYDVTFETPFSNSKNNKRTSDTNITYSGQTCFLERATVTPWQNGNRIGPTRRIDLVAVFYGDDLNVKGIDIDYSEDSQLVMWQRSNSICIDGYGISYRGVNITLLDYIQVPIQRNWYRINKNTSDLFAIELRPLHRGGKIKFDVTSVNVTARNIRYSCNGRSPGTVREFTKNHIYSLTNTYWHLNWNICHYKTSPKVVEDMKYKIETIPPSKVDFTMRAEDLSKEYVFLNITDICQIGSIMVGYEEETSKQRSSPVVLPVDSYLYMDSQVRDLKVTRFSSNFVTIRWQPVTRRVTSFNCSVIYTVKFTPDSYMTPSLAKRYNFTSGFEFVTSNNYFTFRGQIIHLLSVSVQMAHDKRYPFATPTSISGLYFLPGRNVTVDSLRVASVRKDSVRFEWPQYSGPVDSDVTEYKVRVTKGNVTQEIVTTDLDLEWKGDPCLLHGVTVQAIQNGRPVGNVSRLNLTTYFYEDNTPDTTVIQVFMNACDMKSASVQPVHKGQLVGWPTYCNLTGIRSGSIPKLNVSVEEFEYSTELFVSWMSSTNNLWHDLMCLKDVQVKINVTSGNDFHFEVVNGSEADIRIRGLVPCRKYQVQVFTNDGFFHYNKSHVIPSEDSVGVLAIKEKHVQNTSAILNLTLKKAVGDCLPDISVICHPPVESDHYQLTLNVSNSATLVLQGLIPDETYYCYLIVSGEGRAETLDVFLKTPATFTELKDVTGSSENESAVERKPEVTNTNHILSDGSLLVAGCLFVIFGVTIMYYRSVNVFIITTLSFSKSRLENVASRVMGGTRTPPHRLMEEELGET